jgi:hypothetical protein
VVLLKIQISWDVKLYRWGHVTDILNDHITFI